MGVSRWRFSLDVRESTMERVEGSSGIERVMS